MIAGRRLQKGTWLEGWAPNEDTFWQERGRWTAWWTLSITTTALTLSHGTWFVMSALVVLLPGAGFDLTTEQLFWLAAVPGISAGTLRMVHTFLVPTFGTRSVVSVSSLILLIPLLGLTFAVQNPDTPYLAFLLLAFMAGTGGGNFSSFMPSTSLFFPKRLQGTALGIQAGIANLGVSLVQFLTPWIVGFAAFGALGGAAQSLGGADPPWLQNATLVWVPPVAVVAALAWVGLRSVPAGARLGEQLGVLTEKHCWVMTSLYFMTFGSFAGFSASLPLLIRDLYGSFDNAPDPLSYAFLGPLMGSVARVASGGIADRFGGARITQIAAIGLVASVVWLLFLMEPTSSDSFRWFLTAMLALFVFSGMGNASIYKQIPSIFPPAASSVVLGWTAAVAAYGPFAFAAAIGTVTALSGHPRGFFVGLTGFYLANLGLNWWYYDRKGGERPC